MTTIVTPEQYAAEVAVAGPFGQMRALNSALLERIAFASEHGLSYGGERDMNAALGRVKDLTIANYRARYRRGGIFQRGIKAKPSATWVDGMTIQQDADPERSTPFEEEITALFERLDAFEKLKRADILAALGRYSAVLIGAPKLSGDGWLEQPLEFGSEGPLFLRPLAEDIAKIDRIVTDPFDERYGHPEFYSIKVAAGDGGVERWVKVHWTRVVHVVESALESDVYGIPMGEAVWDYFDDLIKVVGGGSEAAWKQQDPGMSFSVDPKAPVTPEDVKKLKTEILEYQHDPRKRYVLSRGVDVTQLNAGTPSFGHNAETLIQLIAGTWEIPMRILLGSERGELASSQDERNFNRRMDERGRWAIKLVRSLIDRLVDHGGIQSDAADYEIIRPLAEEMDEAERAELSKALADTNRLQRQAGDSVVMTSAEIRDRLWGLDPLDEATGDGDLLDEPEPAAAAAEIADPPDSDEWRAVTDAARAAEGRTERAWSEAWSAIGDDAIDWRAVETSLRSVEVESVARALAIEDPEARDEALNAALSAPLALVDEGLSAIGDELVDALAESDLGVQADAAARYLRAVNRRGSFFASASAVSRLVGRFRGSAFAFDMTNPRAVEFASTVAASLVVEINETTRAGLRELLAARLSGGVSHAKAVSEIRATIGLHQRYAQAVVRLGERLATAEPGSLVMAGSMRIRIPKSGASQAFIDRRAAQYGSRLLSARARTIARTETLRAANAGLRETWRQAIEAGELPSTVKRFWIHSGAARPRPEHVDQAASGEEVGVDESFSIGVEPGEEPNCGCAQGLTRGDGSRL